MPTSPVLVHAPIEIYQKTARQATQLILLTYQPLTLSPKAKILNFFVLKVLAATSHKRKGYALRTQTSRCGAGNRMGLYRENAKEHANYMLNPGFRRHIAPIGDPKVEHDGN